MIQVSNISKSFGTVRAVHNVSFTIEAGTTLALVGTSGSGKTTLMRLINRLIEPDYGTIRINDQDIATQSPHLLRRSIGFVVQQTGLFPHLNVGQNIGTVPRLLGWEPSRIRQRVEDLLSQVQLPYADYAHRMPHELSGGQQQRIGLARALAADPPVVLMDEPFGALDPTTRPQIRRELFGLEEFQNKTVVLVTHDLEEAVDVADQILVIDRGQTQQLGSAAEILLQPTNGFVQDFTREHRAGLLWHRLSLADLIPFLPELSAATAGLPTTLTLAEAVTQVGSERPRLLALLKQLEVQP